MNTELAASNFKAMCEALDIPFYRFSPKLNDVIIIIIQYSDKVLSKINVVQEIL